MVGDVAHGIVDLDLTDPVELEIAERRRQREERRINGSRAVTAGMESMAWDSNVGKQLRQAKALAALNHDGLRAGLNSSIGDPRKAGRLPSEVVQVDPVVEQIEHNRKLRSERRARYQVSAHAVETLRHEIMTETTSATRWDRRRQRTDPAEEEYRKLAGKHADGTSMTILETSGTLSRRQARLAHEKKKSVKTTFHRPETGLSSLTRQDQEQILQQVQSAEREIGGLSVRSSLQHLLQLEQQQQWGHFDDSASEIYEF